MQVLHENLPLLGRTLVTMILDDWPETGSSSGVTCIVTETPLFDSV